MDTPDRDQVTVPPDGRAHKEQPKWRKDFPIDWPQDEYVSRRDLIKFIGLTSASFVTGQFALVIKSIFDRRAAPAETLAIASVDELAVGETKLFEYPAGSTPRMLARLGEDHFVAYDQQCTHLLCPVIPEVVEGKFHCPCHNGWFDAATGNVVAGPPPRPLPRITLETRDGVVYATGIQRRTS